MLKINVSDVVKVLSVDDHGVCDDCSGRAWVRCSALSFFDDDEQYMTLTAFGPTADMILDHHTGSNMRRAFVCGTLEVTMGKINQKVTFNGVTKTVILPDPRFQIIANSFSFIDKNNWGETKGEAIVATDDDEPIDLTGIGTVKSTGKAPRISIEETAATSDPAGEVYEKPTTNKPTTAREKKKPTRK